MRRLASSVALFASLVLLATGCGGGGGQTTAPLPPSSGANSGAKTSAVLKLTIPSGTSASGAARQPATISTQTQSVTVAVNGSTPQVFNVAAPLCTTSAPITCTLTVQAIVGSDTFVVSTYSGSNGTGSLLNQATLAFTIVGNGPNNLAAVLGDAVSSLADSGAGSLRAVAAAAAPGDTITFAQGLTGIITLTSGPIVLTKNVTISGSGASTMTVSGGNTSQVFTVNTGVTATLSAFTVANGKNDTGGGILNNGTLTVANMTFANNTTSTGNSQSYFGGAIANEGTLTVTGSTFTGNTSPEQLGEGGAVYNDLGATLTVTNSTFTGNSAQFGGAIGNESANAAVTGSTFTSNTAISPSTNDFPLGGAIYSFGDVTISGSTFATNVAGGNAANDALGGAIAEDGFITTGLVLSTSTFTSNKAGVPSAGDHSGQGGAVYDDSGDTAVLTGNTFGGSSSTGNVASGVDMDSSGGAVSIDYPLGGMQLTSLTLGAGNTFSFNSVSSQTTFIQSGGGAVSVTFRAANLTITGANTFANNTVTAGPGPSGGIAVGGAIDSESGGTFDLSAANGTTFSSNSASAPDSMGNAAGGAIEYFDSLVVACCQGAAIHRRATPAGNATQRAEAAQRALPRSTQHGTAKAIARHAAALTRRSSAGTRRTTSQPASAYTIAGVTFTGNSATGGTASQFGSTGGAVDLGSNGNTFAVTNATFTSNSSAGQGAFGGALFETAGAVVISSSQFTSNTATYGAGAMEVNSNGSLTLINSTVSGNTATAVAQGGAGGGGVISGSGSNLFVSGSTIANNHMLGSAARSGGGGIQMYSGSPATATIVNSTISGNTSSVDGGGIDSQASYTIALTNVTLYGNTASSGSGGNLYNEASITFENTIVAAGSAATGNDIVNNSPGFQGTNGGNLIGTTGGTVTGSGSFGALPGGATPDLTGVNPQLLALASNGGPTQTMADQTGSPGKAHVPFAAGVCGRAGPAVDQRGKNRGSGGFCDIGAYEFAGF